MTRTRKKWILLGFFLLLAAGAVAWLTLDAIPKPPQVRAFAENLKVAAANATVALKKTTAQALARVRGGESAESPEKPPEAEAAGTPAPPSEPAQESAPAPDPEPTTATAELAAAPASNETTYAPAGRPTPKPAARTAALPAPKKQNRKTPEASPTPAQSPKADGAQGNEPIVLARAEYKNLGTVDFFAPIVTPTPTPTPPPAHTPKPANLQRALASWVLEYPKNNKTVWVFTDKRTKEEVEVEINKPVSLTEGQTPFEAMVTPFGKWGVQFEYEGQTKTFSLTE